MTQETVQLKIGKNTFHVRIPNLMGVAVPAYTLGVPDVRAEIARSLDAPIGSERLEKLAHGRKNAVIVVNDITRPYPGGEMVLEIAQRLHRAGMRDGQIALIVAYGQHRKNTVEELTAAFGEEVVSRFRIIHHDCREDAQLADLGTTQGGVRVVVNKAFAEADLKILTGCIAPHQFAGFSGGRKSVVPGIAGLETIQKHHFFPIRPEKASMGVLEGNRFHEEAVRAARIAGVDFIVNAVENTEREIVRCVSGDLEEAFYAGAELSRKIWTVYVPEKPDVVIVSPGGFPRDIDLHQSQKSLACAEMLCRENGGVILCAACPDGAGKPGVLLEKADSPDEVMEDFLREGHKPNGNGKAYMIAKATKAFHVVLAGSAISKEQAQAMFMDAFDTVEEAVDAMLERYGREAKILVVPSASEIIPCFGKGE